MRLRSQLLLFGAILTTLVSGCSSADTKSSSTSPTASPAASYQRVDDYDPARDAAADINAAMAEAARTHRHVLLEVGGEWCIWCHYMDDFFAAHPELTMLREQNYVMVKINYSEENENQEVLSRYPKITGYPHIFILDAHGKLLHSENTAELEQGSSYNLKKFLSFLEQWAPA